VKLKKSRRKQDYKKEDSLAPLSSGFFLLYYFFLNVNAPGRLKAMTQAG
jgi:hypothetical protein